MEGNTARPGGAAIPVLLPGGDSGAGKSERIRPTMMVPIERQMMAVLLRVKVQAEQGTLEQTHADIMRLDPEIFDTHPEVCFSTYFKWVSGKHTEQQFHSNDAAVRNLIF